MLGKLEPPEYRPTSYVGLQTDKDGSLLPNGRVTRKTVDVKKNLSNRGVASAPSPIIHPSADELARGSIK
jgi:hypothetical protein